MAATQISTSVTIISSLLGFQAVSLSAMETTSAPSIMAGSKLEVAGAFFTWGTDELPNASSWTAISTTGTGYLVCTPSGSAGNQILTSSYVSTVSVWVTSKQGWYTSTGSSIRVIGTVYKGGTSSYERKMLYQGVSNAPDYGLGYVSSVMHRTSTASIMFRYGVSENDGQPGLRTKVVEIGEWNMQSTAIVTVAHGISSAVTRIVACNVLIRNDAGALSYPIDRWLVGQNSWGNYAIDATDITLTRIASGGFDATNYDATAGTVANRGFITLVYQV